MKCRIHKCKAACCYNATLPLYFVDVHESKIINPIIGRKLLHPHPQLGYSEAITTNVDIDKNKCPFLRGDYKCNVYEYRPQICRIFGVEDHPLLKCQYIKK